MMRVIDNKRLNLMKKALPLSELIRYWLPDLAKLGPKGDNHYSICPFHTEKTASFCVNDKKGIYHCFGCGVHGDHIWFLEQSRIENIKRQTHERVYISPIPDNGRWNYDRIMMINFMDHVRKLSQITGIPIKGKYKIKGSS